jgi:hypothetical protein
MPTRVQGILARRRATMRTGVSNVRPAVIRAGGPSGSGGWRRAHRRLAAGKPGLLGGFLLAASIIPVGDAIIVLRGNGPKATVYGVHAATAAVMLAAATFLFV